VRAAFAALIVSTALCVWLLCAALALHSQHSRVFHHVDLRLNWHPELTFAGPYVAKFSNLWAQRGLEVEILPGGGDLDPIPLVAKSPRDRRAFGIVGADRFMLAVANGADLIAVAVDFQQNPVAWMVRDKSGIHRPKHFEGRKVGVRQNEESTLIYLALLRAGNVNRSQIDEVQVQFSMEPFLKKEVDALPVYINDEPIRAGSKGVHYRLLKPAQYGIELYGNVLFTTSAFLREDGQTVCDFVEGYRAGWRKVLGGSEQAAQLLETNLPELSEMKPRTRRAVLEATLDLLFDRRDSAHRPESVGKMTREGWDRTKAFLVENGNLKDDFDVARVYDDSCTSRASR
jgi:ABC-type nitrate/sulfonate/bicarbonate transport system substrate-binding protein